MTLIYPIRKDVNVPETYPIQGHFFGEDYGHIILTAPESLLANVTPGRGWEYHVEVKQVIHSPPMFRRLTNNRVSVIELFDQKSRKRDRIALIRALTNTKSLVDKLREDGIDLPGINVIIVPKATSCEDAMNSYCMGYGLVEIPQNELDGIIGDELKLAKLRRTYPWVDRLVREFDAVIEPAQIRQ